MYNTDRCSVVNLMKMSGSYLTLCDIICDSIFMIFKGNSSPQKFKSGENVLTFLHQNRFGEI